MGDRRRNLERQASYLVDVVTLDARRRRSRLKIAERFDAGARLVAHVAEARHIQIENRIPADLQSPPMFQAELTTVFSNLVTNAVKAAGEGGKIRATGRRSADGVTLRMENTGVAVNPSRGERWFRPFESSTTRVDAVLGQGMGLGLPITRSMLAGTAAPLSLLSHRAILRRRRDHPAGSIMTSTKRPVVLTIDDNEQSGTELDLLGSAKTSPSHRTMSLPPTFDERMLFSLITSSRNGPVVIKQRR